MILKNTTPSYTIFTQIAVVLLVLVSVIPQFKELYAVFQSFPLFDNIGKESVLTLMKIFSLLLAGGVVSDVCRDNGESAVAGVIEFAVKVMGIVLAVPVLSAVLSVALSFMGN